MCALVESIFHSPVKQHKFKYELDHYKWNTFCAANRFPANKFYAFLIKIFNYTKNPQFVEYSRKSFLFPDVVILIESCSFGAYSMLMLILSS